MSAGSARSASSAPGDVVLPAGLPTAALARLVAELAERPTAPIAQAPADEVWRVHVADSLSALELEELPRAAPIADLGSGAGLPGIPLALALPEARVDLVESIARKARFAEELARAVGADNVFAVALRSEQHAAGEGFEAYDVVTARAVAPLAELAELASPLLRTGGRLIAWKGARDEAEESAFEQAAEMLALEPERVVAARPYRASRNRHLHVARKSAPTPGYLPRRPGAARKGPPRASRHEARRAEKRSEH